MIWTQLVSMSDSHPLGSIGILEPDLLYHLRREIDIHGLGIIGIRESKGTILIRNAWGIGEYKGAIIALALLKSRDAFIASMKAEFLGAYLATYIQVTI